MFQAFEYRIPLIRPLPLPGQEPLLERHGFLLHDPETGGWGDAVPLPGFSPETVEDLRSGIQAEDWDASGLPSLRFAASSARSEFKTPPVPVCCNGLWIQSEETVDGVDARLEGWDNPVLKVKPGPEPDTAPLVELARRRPEIRYRLDGNRQWTVEQTLQLMESLPTAQVEYLEEPLMEPGEYQSLWARSPVPIALDETLLTSGALEIADSAHVVAFVLKPTLLGGETDRETWLNLAEQEEKHIIWSSCFESGVGLWNLVRLAAGGIPAGLDTGAWLETDLISPRPLPVRGRIFSPETLQIDPSFLHRKT